jgi:hypothetical protein
MRRGIILAWMTGLTIITWREVTCAKRPPMPGQLAAASGFFILVAAMGEFPGAAPAATALAFGIDLAALLKVLPGSKCSKQPAAAASTLTPGQPGSAGAPAATLTGAK